MAPKPVVGNSALLVHRVRSGLTRRPLAKFAASILPPGHGHYSIAGMDAEDTVEGHVKVLAAQIPDALPEGCRAIYLEHTQARYAAEDRMAAEAKHLRATYERDMVRVFAEEGKNLLMSLQKATATVVDEAVDIPFPESVYTRYAAAATELRQQHWFEIEALSASQVSAAVVLFSKHVPPPTKASNR